MGVSKFNSERYYDPTCYAALTAVIKQEREERRRQKDAWKEPAKGKFMPKVYLSFARTGDALRDMETAVRYTRFAVEAGYIPCSAQCLFPEYLSSGKQSERELGEFMACVYLDGCKEIWVFGSGTTAGMEKEADRASDRGMKMRRFTEDCKEVSV